MIDIEALKPQIVERLKPLNPEKIILFGSYAYGTPNEESDIDLYVVTGDDVMPQSWREKMDIYLKYAEQIEDIMYKYPVDLITHTKKMNEKFLKLNSSFSRKIYQEGKVLYAQS